MILDCVHLGYLKDSDLVCDPTYGRGIWWKRWRPTRGIVATDLQTGVDFRDLPYPAATFDVVAFDPPYVSIGGRETSNLPEFNARFGLIETPRTPQELLAMNLKGLAEVNRVLKPRGKALVKSKDYIWSGKYFAGTHYVLVAALDLGFELVDRLEYITKAGGAQPKRTRKNGRPSVQQHARRNLSTLLVLQKGAS